MKMTSSKVNFLNSAAFYFKLFVTQCSGMFLIGFEITLLSKITFELGNGKNKPIEADSILSPLR